VISGQGPLPTIADVLNLSVVRYARPEVLAKPDRLTRSVRWAHVSEVPDIASLLQGGELILTTGIALPDGDAELRAYADALAEVGAAGLMVELGRRFAALPRALTAACERNGLPLIAFHREVKFVKLTEAVNSLIVDEQVTGLRAAVQAHEVFTTLCVNGATAEQIVRAASDLAGCPVIFENLMRQVLAYEPAGVPADDLLRNWEARSRDALARSGTAVVDHEGWVMTPVRLRNEVWGRLIFVVDARPTAAQTMVLERAAVTLTLNQLQQRNQETAERHAQRSILSDILAQRYTSSHAMHARTAALGVPTARHSLVAVAIAPPESDAAEPASATHPNTHEVADRHAELVGRAVREAGVRALVGALPDKQVGVLLTLEDASGPSAREETLNRISAHIHDAATSGRSDIAMIVGVGSTVTDLDDVAQSFAEASYVAEAASGSPVTKSYYELSDIQLRGLMRILGDDTRVQAFVERMLGRLIDHDIRRNTELLRCLRVFLANGGNKSATAAGAHMSRQALYQRLAVIERILGMDLESAETRTSLHAAIMALDSHGR
jgi:purine catabolism regulator